jgi:FkbM family methyltransferase
MGANSLPRRVVKKLLAPVLTPKVYSVLQAAAMAWDIRRGAWTEPEIELIPLSVRPGETAIDIGANYGLYAYHLSRAVGERGKVYAFEPIEFTSKTFRLVGRLLSFKAVELHQKGCSDKDGLISFSVPVTDTGAISAGQAHISKRDDERIGKEQHAGYLKTKEVQCEVVALDAFLPGLSNVSFIKCDIEGADLFALRGAKDIIARNHPTVVVEIVPWFLEGLGLRIEDIVGFFSQMGYALYRYQDGRLYPWRAEDVVEDNWVFVHPDRRSRVASIIAT